jgi:hypothetical protein
MPMRVKRKRPIFAHFGATDTADNSLDIAHAVTVAPQVFERGASADAQHRGDLVYISPKVKKAAALFNLLLGGHRFDFGFTLRRLGLAKYENPLVRCRPGAAKF